MKKKIFGLLLAIGLVVALVLPSIPTGAVLKSIDSTILQKAYSQGEEIVSKRGRYSRTYQNEDKSFTTEFVGSPEFTFYRDSWGSFYTPYVFEDNISYYQVQHPWSSTRFYDNYTEVWNEAFTEVVVYDDRWIIEYKNSKDRWIDASFYDITRSYQFVSNGVKIIRTGTTDIGQREDIYYYRGGAPCKIEVQITPSEAQEVRFVWQQSGIVASSELSEIDGSTNKISGIRFADNSGNNVWICRWNEELNIVDNVTVVAESHAQGRKATVTFESISVSAGQTAILDPDTFYPDAHVESDSVDGYASHSQTLSWANLRAAVGSSSDDSGAQMFVGIDSDFRPGSNWRGIYRAAVLFDTSSINDGATVTDAKLSLYGNSKSDAAGITPSINVYTSNPASDTAIVAGDYDSFGSTALSTEITYAAYNTSGYNDFTLNATGRAAISLTGVTKLGFREGNYDGPNVQPSSGVGYQLTYFSGYTADNGSNKPKLVVTYTVVSLPTVTTQAVSSIEETTATGNGNITDDGGDSGATRGMCWDTSSSPTTSDSHATNGTGEGAYTVGLTGLSPGTKYYVRAYSINSAGTSYGSEVNFTTKPNPPTSLSCNVISQTQINLTWSKGSGAEKTLIRRKVGSYPSSVSDGTQVYFNTGTSHNDTTCSCGTHYYYRAWSYKTGAPNSGYSDATSDDNATTEPCVEAPTVTTYSATSVEETTATTRGYVNDTGGENPNRYIDYDINSGEPYAYTKDCGVGGTGYFYGYLTGLTKGEKYYFRARAVNSGGTGTGSQLTFITKPDAPSSLSATPVSSSQINLTWNKGTGTYYTYVRRKEGSYPTSYTDGDEVYTGTNSSKSDTGLDRKKTYYYRAWSRAYDGGWGPYSDGYSSASATTFAEVPTVTTQAATSIEDTTATGNGNITDTGDENCDKRGIVWDLASHGNPGNVAPGDSDYANDVVENGDFGTGAFTRSLTGLPTGDTIYCRAYAHNSGGYDYGAEVNFLTKPAAPTNVAATDGTHSDKVVVTWTKSTGATDYHVWRDAVDLGAAGDVATFDDSGAITAGSVVATDGSSTSLVALSLSGTSVANGTTYTYKVVASNATGDSDDSTTDTGYRLASALTYQWNRSAADSDADYSTISGATSSTYNDTDAPSPTITGGTTVATDGTETAHVGLSLTGTSLNDGAGRYWTCTLVSTDADNTPQTATANRGYTGGGSLSYQWQRSAADASDTWLGTWEKRVELTISNTNVDDTLTDFPILVYLSDSSGQGSDDVSFIFDELVDDANRKKIAITTDDELTECYVEIEKWDDAGEKAWLWTRVPSIASGTTTTLFLYFDVDHADNTAYVGDVGDEVAEKVWDSSFVFVDHMQDGSDTSHTRDSTSNDNDGTKKAANEPNEITGKIGEAQDFDATNDKIDFGNACNMGLSDFTIESIIKADATQLGAYPAILDKGNAGGIGYKFYTIKTTGLLRASVGNTYGSPSGGTDIHDGVTHYVAARYDRSSYVYFYLDGVQDGDPFDISAEVATDLDTVDSLIAGARTPGNSDFFGGIIDEARISIGLRSVAWIKATYYSSWDDIVTYGSEETTIWTDLVGATSSTYNDTDAPKGVITPGTSSASDGASADHVVLSLAGESVADGATRYFRSILTSANARVVNSVANDGYRTTGPITYQWQRSSADSDADYSNIGGGTTDPYNDTEAPANGDGRYFKCIESATGTDSQTSTSDRGFRSSVPTVVTNAVEDVEETTATLSGNITHLGGWADADDRGFEWDIDSGAPYADSWSEAGSFSTGVFTHGVTGLVRGELYYTRAMANNDEEGWGYGSEVTFLTKPNAPYDVAASATAHGVITLTWSKGTGAQKTYIRGKAGSYPTDRADGYEVYNDTGATTTDTSLTGGTTYYYRAWSYATEGGKEQYSDSYDEDYALAIERPSISTVAATSVETTTATINGNITNTGGQSNSSRGFVWDTTTHGDPGNTAPGASAYASNNTDAGVFGTGAFSHGLTSLTPDDTYYFRACSYNSMGWTYGNELTFDTLDLALWFQPVTIISGETIVDRAGNHDGIVTWGGRIADSGSTTTLVDTEMTQTEDYWKGNVVVIVQTTDGLAPQGESGIISAFAAATDELTFAELTAAVGAGDLYEIWEAGSSILWGSFPEGVEIDIGPIVAYASPVSEALIVGDPETAVEPPEPDTLWGGAAATNLPLYPLFNSVAINLGWSAATLYVALTFGVAMGLGVVVLIITGSSLAATAMVGIGMFAGTAMDILPLWIIIVYAILAGSWIYLAGKV